MKSVRRKLITLSGTGCLNIRLDAGLQSPYRTSIGRRKIEQPRVPMNKLCKLLAAIVAIALSGCAGAGGLPPDVTIQPYQQPSPQAELMYHILVGEIAGKRGQLDIALDNYQWVARSSDDPKVVERALGIAMFIHNDTVALEMARRWYVLESGSLPSRQILALALLRNGLVDESIEHLDHILKASNKDRQEGFGTITALLSQVSDKAVIFKAMSRLRARHPTSKFALFYYALAAMGVKDYQQALEGVNAALGRDPKWAEANILRAQVMMELGDPATGLKDLAAAVSASPQDADLRTGYARLLVSSGRLDEAGKQFEILAKQHPENAGTQFALGLLATEAGQYNDAKLYFMKVLQLGERVAEAYYELGRVEELQDHFREARDWYARVNQEDERYLSAQVKVGEMLAGMGDYPAMTSHFVEVREEIPQSEITLYISEAEILSSRGRPQEAYQLLSKALEQNPDDKDLLYSRALIAEKLDRLDWLEQDLRRLIEADPNNGQALNALGYTLADRTDRYQEALSYLERALALLPNDPAVLDSMGWVQYRLGHYQEALSYLQRAYERQPDGEIAAHLIEVLWFSGRQDEARTIWRGVSEQYAKSNKDPMHDDHLSKVKERFGL